MLKILLALLGKTRSSLRPRNLLLLIAAFTTMGIGHSAKAQMYGPRQWWLAPEGLSIPILTGIYTDSNIAIDDGVIYPGFSITSSVAMPSMVRFFDLAGQSAQVSIGVPFVWADAELDTGRRKFRESVSGPADLYLHLATGLVNAPSLEIPEFVQYMTEQNPPVVMYALTALTAPTGKYDSEKAINIGTNRWSFRLGLPTTIRLSKNWQPGKTTTLEILPVVDFFTPNNNPPLSSARVSLNVPVQVPITTIDENGNSVVTFEERTVETAVNLGETDLIPDQVWQKPLYSIEAHLTHDITDRLWVSLDSYSVFGGETVSDGEAQGNEQSWSALGGTVGVVPWKDARLTVSGGSVISRNENSMDGYQVMVQYQHYF